MTLRLVCIFLVLLALPGEADEATATFRDDEKVAVVFGSFSAQDNAVRWADEVERRLSADVGVERIDSGLYRVKTPALFAQDAYRLLRLARERGLDAWRLRTSAKIPAADVLHGNAPTSEATAEKPAETDAMPAVGIRGEAVRSDAGEVLEPARDPVTPAASPALKRTPAWQAPSEPEPSMLVEWSGEIAVESRFFQHVGASRQDRWAPSASVEGTFYLATDDERWSLTATPYVRFDAQDSRRNRGDLREFFASRVGDNWEVHLGARQVFWGVTEFSHLVDIINQTDLVENIDGEDKLGQPMLSLSRVTNWGIVDVYALLGARERTFPGIDGRLRTIAPVATSQASFDSGAGRERVDAAIRWTHFLGPAEIGLYHFSGTTREPILEPVFANGDWWLTPRYTTIDQTGLDAQYLFGDTALKLEAIRRSGFGDTYLAANLGIEHTLVGAFGGRSDVGLVLEYLWDERGDEAFNTVFERDIAIGSRWQFNDAADTHALVGVIWDPSSDESQYSVEAGRRLGDMWSLNLEARLFSGDAPDEIDVISSLLDADRKLSSVTRDDYLQLEVVRYF